MSLKFDEWHRKNIRHPFYTTSNFVHHFKSIGEFKLELQSGNAQFGYKLAIFFYPRELEIWRMTLKNNRAPLLYYIKLSAAFQNHGHIQTGVAVRKRPIRVTIGIFVPGDFENWRMTLKNNRAPLLYYVKLCASFQILWLSQTWVTAWKRSRRVKKNGDFLSRVTLKIDVWPLKTIGHLTDAASTFVHNFIANG